MRKEVFCAFAVVLIVFSLIVFPGCQTPLTSPSAGLAVQKTAIAVDPQARIAVGDDLIVYGTGAVTGVACIFPSAGDTVGRMIPNGDNFSSQNFAVVGRKIALVADHQVTIYNVADNTSFPIPLTDVYLADVPVGMHRPGNIQGSGNYFAVLNDPTKVSDGKAVKVIDVSGDTPVVVSFAEETFGGNAVEQVAVDGIAKRVAAATSQTIYIYDITNPAAAPIAQSLAEGLWSQIPMMMGHGRLLYAGGTGGQPIVHLLDLDNSSLTDVPLMTGGWFMAMMPLAFNGGDYAFFLGNGAQGGSYRCVFGSIDSATAKANYSMMGGGTMMGPTTQMMPIDGRTGDHGYLGYGRTAAVTPDGTRVFLAGMGAIEPGDYLQVSAGGDFAVLRGPGGDAYGFPASDVTCAGNLVVFKGGAGQNTVLSYIMMP